MQAGSRLLTGSDGRPFEFDPGSFALELLLTGGPGSMNELLRTPADLVDWMVDSRLANIAPLAADQIQVRLSELRLLKEFRDTMWTVARTVAHFGWPEPNQVELINRCVETAMRLELDPFADVRRWAAPITGADVLGTAARDAVDIIGGRAPRLRECQAEDCYLLFFDTSRPGSRRWCSMRRCGNRHKVQTFRARSEH
ncbi:MAG: CGNR zinc finger domain-containing protein [Haloechinothrix sp.]